LNWACSEIKLVVEYGTKIFFQPPSGKTFALTLAKKATISEIKSKCAVVLGSRPEKLALLFGDQQLDDKYSLEHYGIDDVK